MGMIQATALASVGLILAAAVAGRAAAPDRVTTRAGIVEGTAGVHTGVRAFKGIPYAAPPVGDLRWKAPQSAASWTGVRQAAQFGPRCMQQSLFSDMVFRSNGVSEDCLYLNVWTPAKAANERLPVLVYFYGGGFVAGDGSEPRYDGDSMASKGIVSLTVNYRLGVFGFFAHPELTKESPHHASGNYALLDQVAALEWVKANIAAFGGDPARVTIAGESAGSISVSALMASPLSKPLIAGAIGESGALINPTLPPVTLADGEAAGVKFATEAGAPSLGALRAMSAADLAKAAASSPVGRFSATLDGYVLPQSPADILAAGAQAHVPLLAGWNSEENNGRTLFGANPVTAENFKTVLTTIFGAHAAEAAALYPSSTPDELMASATDLASARFIAFSTWKWLDVHTRTGGKPVYRYYYSHPRPQPTAPPAANGRTAPVPTGAVHSAEIEYAMGNLTSNTAFAWTADDRKVSDTMQAYFANFVKTGDPNGPGLPTWPANTNGSPVQFMHLDVVSHAEPDVHRARYLLLDQVYSASSK